MLSRSTGSNSNRAKVIAANNLPVANTAAVITIAAVAGKTITIHGCQWSYSLSPTGGNLLITTNTGATTLISLDITAAGPGGFNFAIPGLPNKNVTLTLASGTGSCVGKLNVQYVIEP